jgi:anionic cell wall polymer biosynthesis LytR-Cps2A-Psr (LCP) family protein
MVDAVGGIEVRVTRRFKYTWLEGLYRKGRFPAEHGGVFTKGIEHMDGERALAFARARYTSNPRESSDFARSIRQSKVLKGLRDKLGSGGLSSFGPGLSMMDALEGNLKTNLSAFDLFLLSGHLSPDRRIELKEGRILEATTNTIGQYILVVVGRADSTDYGPLQRYLDRQLARPIPSRSAAPS